MDTTFAARSSTSGNYKILEVTIRQGGRWGEDVCTIQWQCNPGESDWYGLEFTCQTRKPDTAQTFAQLVKRFTKGKDGYPIEPTPALVLASLRKLGAIETKYDGRLNTYVPLPDILPPDYEMYYDHVDDYDPSASGCLCNVQARNTDEAKRLAAEKIGGYMADDNHSAQARKWFDAGMPLRRTLHNGTVDTRSMSELMQ